MKFHRPPLFRKRKFEPVIMVSCNNLAPIRRVRTGSGQTESVRITSEMSLNKSAVSALESLVQLNCLRRCLVHTSFDRLCS
jgi:hypothetical protein